MGEQQRWQLALAVRGVDCLTLWKRSTRCGIERLSQLRGQAWVQCDLDAAEMSVERSLVL